MKKILEGDAEFIKKELKRLGKMIESNEVAFEKKKELERKQNILQKFQYFTRMAPQSEL